MYANGECRAYIELLAHQLTKLSIKCIENEEGRDTCSYIFLVVENPATLYVLNLLGREYCIRVVAPRDGFFPFSCLI